MHLACCLFRLTMPEALVAATLNSAYSLGRGTTHGALCEGSPWCFFTNDNTLFSTGRQADLLVLSTSDWRQLIYQCVDVMQLIMTLVFRFGNATDLIRCVVKGGDVVYGE